MVHKDLKYNNLFTVEERKKIIAQSMADLRKSTGLSQKEAAASIGISQATYSAYERGRNEPPAEILVRLSYLFKCPIDILVQRDRVYRDANDALKQVEQLHAQMLQLEEDMSKTGGENETAKAMMEVMKKMGEALVQTAQRPDFVSKLEDPLR